MRKSAHGTVFAASVVVAAVLADATRAMAQIVQSEVDSEPGISETTTLVTSNTEVRRSVLGLLTLAFLVGVLAIIYWYKTGQQARERFARKFGGRHLAGQGRHDVMDHGGHWGTEAGMVQPVFATQQSHGLPTFGTHGVANRAYDYPVTLPGTGPEVPTWASGTAPTWEPVRPDYRLGQRESSPSPRRSRGR